MSAEHHGERVDLTCTELWSYRGGCVGCGWIGPHRDTQDQAQRDAQQHLVDVRRYPHPDVEGRR